jgi:antitoxin CptB
MADEDRLRWRCRRGMLELDLMLNDFLDQGLEQLDAGEQSIFQRLLDYPDQMLLEMLMGRMVPADKETVHVIGKIRSSVRPPP